MKNRCLVFDLDDTLVYEIDYLKSAYKEIAKDLFPEEYDIMLEKYHNGENVFQYLQNKYDIDKNNLLNRYRNHFPTLNLIEGAREVLDYCKENGYILGLVTDGRSITQRNKLKALELENIFHKIIISEEFGMTKPNEQNYKVFEEFSCEEYFYIGDNVKKDFITPNRIGWISICLLNKGKNIHSQIFEDYGDEYQPKYKIESLKEIIKLL